MNRLRVALACALLPATAFAEPIELRPGGWEIVTSMSGMGSSAPERQCMSAQDLSDLRILKLDDGESEGCTMREISQTKTRLEALQTCAGDDERQVRYVIEAPSPTAFNGTISLVGGTPEQTVTIDATWIQASCDGFED